MSLSDMQVPIEPSTAHQLTHYDGTQRTVYVTQHEIAYPDGRLIISRTDLNGVLTHANDAFVELSGYERDEVIGQPHTILRHPDIPKIVYKEMWETLVAGKKWHGYVKNLRKDGGHYWVYATAVPNIRGGKAVGYTSVRRKPSRRKIEEISAVYKQQLATERGQA